MNEHSQVTDLLPLYVSGALANEQRQAVEKHLAICAECQADLDLWQMLAQEITLADQALVAPQGGLFDQVLVKIRTTPQPAASPLAQLKRAGLLLRAQAPLVQREIWPASAAVIGLGYTAAVVASHSGFIYALAPLTAATCVALIYGPEYDSAYELALSTPTSPRQILLARLALVFGFNLGLVLLAVLGLLPVLQPPLPQLLWSDLVLAWLAPMAFLSAAALALSVWIGAPNAISITYVAWLSYLLAGPLRSPDAVLKLSTTLLEWMAVYQQFWQTPTLLLALSGLLVIAALWQTGQAKHRQYLLS